MPHRVLIVDDNPLNRKLASELLISEGYDVEETDSAAGLMAAFQERALPDLILMDIGLPGTDGLTLARRLKADDRYRAIPIVAWTAYAMKGDADKAYAAGCDGYLTKPIDTRSFAVSVGRHLRPAPLPARLRVMVVEDNRIDLRLAGECAELCGHEVLSSVTAEQALDHLAAAMPHVVLLDLNLPGIDGLEFMQRMRANESTRLIPVVAATAYPDDGQRAELLAAGCVAYLVKPVNTRTVMHELEQAARSARMEDRPRQPGAAG